MLWLVRVLEVIINKISNFVNKNISLSTEEKEMFTYGLKGILMTTTKLLVILLLSFFLNNFNNTIIFMLCYFPLRTFSFGIHLSKSRDCWFFSLIAFLIIPFLITKIDLPTNIFLILLIIYLPFYTIWAPADTVKKPMLNKKKRIFSKFLTLFILFIYIILLNFVPKNISTSMLWAATFQLFLISPFTYKIFGQPYRNYLNFDIKERRKT